MSTRAQILAEIAAQFPDNTSGAITPAKLRQVTEDLANSYNNSTDEGTPAASITDLAEGRAPLLTGTQAQARAAIGAAAAIAQSVFNGLVNISCFGDSLTSGSGGTPYPTTLALLSGCNVTNGGIGGETSAQIAARYVAATARHNDSLVIWAGRNDIGTAATAAQVVANVQSVVTAAGHSRYLVIGVTTATNDSAGNMTHIGSVNTLLASTFPGHYFDVNAYLVASGCADASVVPDAQSLTEIAAGKVPHQLLSDGIHFTTASYGLVAAQVFARFDAVFYAGIQYAAPSLKDLLSADARLIRATAVTVGSSATRMDASGDGSFSFTKKLIPSADNTHDLGFSASAYRWRNGFFSDLVQCSALVQPTETTPASATANGTKGTIVWDASYVYVCTATNTWKRAAIATW